MNKLIFVILLIASSLTGVAQQAITLAEKIVYKVNIRDAENPDNSNIYGNIDETQRIFYLNNLLEAVKSGKIKAYGDEDFLFELSIEELDNIMTIRDTAYVPNPDNPSEQMMVAVEEDISVEEITALNFIEQWSFDKNTMQTVKKVIAVAPLLELMVETEKGGEAIGHKILFWVKF